MCMSTKKPSFGGPAARQARKSIETLNDQRMRRKAIVTTDDVDVYLQTQEADDQIAAATADAATRYPLPTAAPAGAPAGARAPVPALVQGSTMLR